MSSHNEEIPKPNRIGDASAALAMANQTQLIAAAAQWCELEQIATLVITILYYWCRALFGCDRALRVTGIANFSR